MFADLCGDKNVGSGGRRDGIRTSGQSPRVGISGAPISPLWILLPHSPPWLPTKSLRPLAPPPGDPLPTLDAYRPPSGGRGGGRHRGYRRSAGGGPQMHHVLIWTDWIRSHLGRSPHHRLFQRLFNLTQNDILIDQGAPRDWQASFYISRSGVLDWPLAPAELRYFRLRDAMNRLTGTFGPIWTGYCKKKNIH